MDFLLQTVCPFGSSHSVGSTASSLGQTFPASWACCKKKDSSEEAPRKATHGTGSTCSHRGSIQLVSWKLIIGSPSGSPASLSPGVFLFAFTLQKKHLPLVSRDLISSNGGGGCPWTASCSCPLLVGRRIGDWSLGTLKMFV